MRSRTPVPLVETLVDDVYANYFPAENEQVWTFRNTGSKDIDSTVIGVSHIAGSRYHDAWNDLPIEPMIVGNIAEVALSIAAHGAGCLVRKFQE